MEITQMSIENIALEAAARVKAGETSVNAGEMIGSWGFAMFGEEGRSHVEAVCVEAGLDREGCDAALVQFLSEDYIAAFGEGVCGREIYCILCDIHSKDIVRAVRTKVRALCDDLHDAFETERIAQDEDFCNDGRVWGGSWVMPN